MNAKIVTVVKDPFEADLLTTEDAQVLLRGALRLGVVKPVPVQPDTFALPLNEFQCIHVDLRYEQKLDAPRGTTAPFYVRCTNSIQDWAVHPTGGGYLCSYHDRHLLTRKLSASDLAHTNWWIGDREVQGWSVYSWDVIEGIINHDKRELSKFPIKRVNSLRIHMCPTPPMIKPIQVNPDWEKVELAKT